MSKTLGYLDSIYRYVNAYCPKFFDFEFNEILKDLEVLEILKKRPDLLCCFVHDGVFTWNDYNETYSDEDKQYIGATKEEFEKVKKWLENGK